MMTLDESNRRFRSELDIMQSWIDRLRESHPYIKIKKVKIRGDWHSVYDGRTILKCPDGSEVLTFNWGEMS